VDLKPPSKPDQKELPSWRTYAGMGTEFAGALCGLTLLGVWFDGHYGTGRKATLICASIGLIGGMYNFIRQAMALSAETRKEPHARRTDESRRDDRPTDG